jgi:hypothetical protein
MPTLHSVTVPRKAEQARPTIDTPEMIDRMAADLRARSDTDLPHSFYVALVRRQLAGRSAANTQSDTKADKTHGPASTRPGQAHASVFHSWAFSE